MAKPSGAPGTDPTRPTWQKANMAYCLGGWTFLFIATTWRRAHMALLANRHLTFDAIYMYLSKGEELLCDNDPMHGGDPFGHFKMLTHRTTVGAFVTGVLHGPKDANG